MNSWIRVGSKVSAEGGARVAASQVSSRWRSAPALLEVDAHPKLVPMTELLFVAVTLLIFIAWKVAHIAKRCDQLWKLQGAMTVEFYDPVLERSERAEKALTQITAAVESIDNSVEDLHAWAWESRDAQLTQEMEEAIERDRWVISSAEP